MAVYEELKKYRIEQDMTLESIAEKTKIAIDILQSLDEGHYDVLPLPYTRLFLLSYAKVIGYPREDILRQLEVELATTHKKSNLNVVDLELDETPNNHDDDQVNKALFDNDTISNSNVVKLAGVAIALIFIMIIGKNLLTTNDVDNQPNQELPILLDINEQVILDSLSFDIKDSLTVEVATKIKMYFVFENMMNQKDTITLVEGENKLFSVDSLSRAILWPSHDGFIVVGKDTIPSQFYQSGDGITFHKSKQRLLLSSHPSY